MAKKKESLQSSSVVSQITLFQLRSFIKPFLERLLTSHIFFFFFTVQVFCLFYTHHAVNSYGWIGSNLNSSSFPLVLMKCASLGRAGWCFSWTKVPFSLAPFFLWSSSFTRFRNFSLLLECLIALKGTLILLAGNLPLTWLLTMSTARWVTLRTLLVLPR